MTDKLRLASALAAVAGLGAALNAGPVVISHDRRLDDDLDWGRFSPAPRLRPARRAARTHVQYQASSRTIVPGEDDTRDPKYLHSHARRARAARPQKDSTDGG